MEILDPVHWQAISPELRNLLRSIAALKFSNRFYLAGGTGLALQLGHRASIDLDFFSAEDEVDELTRREITTACAALPSQVLEGGEGYLVLLIDQIHVGFFSYHYPLLQPCKQVDGIALASRIDIGLMNIDALINRGGRKDFYDLYELSRHISLEELLELANTKYTGFRDFPLLAVESMTLFDNADRDLQPLLFNGVPWDEVKKFFIAQSKMLAEKWFNC